MTIPFQWNQAARFSERVERLQLHGLHFQHIALCHRRAWMYLHGINFAQWYEKVALGTVRHANSYRRDHSTEGLFGLAPDRIDWERHIVYENKGSGGAADAVDDQVAFYALMLSIASGIVWQGETHILNTHRNRSVPLDDHQLERLWLASQQLEYLSTQALPPQAKRIGLCDACALANFCGFN